VATHPNIKHADSYKAALTHGAGIRDSTTLTYWGSVIIEANTTGFAMEFIGDMNDSQTPAISYRCDDDIGGIRGQTAVMSGNCDRISSSGVNLN
jgi:hypothetical protein